MKNMTSTLNRLFSKFFSFILLLLVSLAPAINPVVAANESGQLNAAPSFLLPPITVTQTNATSIAIPDHPTLPPAVPYPSTITIAGATGTITNVTVTLNNLTFNRPRDYEMLLVGPGGQAFLIMSDTAGNNGTTSNSAGITITLSDAAASFLPNDAVTGTALVSGTFRPTNNGLVSGDQFAAPAPTVTVAMSPDNAPGGTDSTGTATFASIFAQPGVPANGVWSLYVEDDAGGGTAGVIAGGWTLSVTTDGIPTTAAGANIAGRVVNSEGRAIANVKIGMLNPEGQVRYALTNPFGYFNFADVPAGQTYIFSVKAKGYQPTSVARTITEDVADMEIVIREE